MWGLSIATVDGSKGGAVLALFGGLVAVVGAFMEIRGDQPTSAAA